MKRQVPIQDAPRTNYHILKKGKQWVVQVGGFVIDADPKQRVLMQRYALHCDLMDKQHGFLSEVHIHGKDGQIRAKDTYGRDPVETKG